MRCVGRPRSAPPRRGGAALAAAATRRSESPLTTGRAKAMRRLRASPTLGIGVPRDSRRETDERRLLQGARRVRSHRHGRGEVADLPRGRRDRHVRVRGSYATRPRRRTPHGAAGTSAAGSSLRTDASLGTALTSQGGQLASFVAHRLRLGRRLAQRPTALAWCSASRGYAGLSSTSSRCPSWVARRSPSLVRIGLDADARDATSCGSRASSRGAGRPQCAAPERAARRARLRGEPAPHALSGHGRKRRRESRQVVASPRSWRAQAVSAFFAGRRRSDTSSSRPRGRASARISPPSRSRSASTTTPTRARGSPRCSIADFLPIVVIGLLLGPLVDRLSRRRLMIGSDLVRFGRLRRAPVRRGSPRRVVALAAVSGIATGFFRPAANAGLPNLVRGRRAHERELAHPDGRDARLHGRARPRGRHAHGVAAVRAVRGERGDVPGVGGARLAHPGRQAALRGVRHAGALARRRRRHPARR